jgi:hypothetical protein
MVLPVGLVSLKDKPEGIASDGWTPAARRLGGAVG